MNATVDHARPPYPEARTRAMQLHDARTWTPAEAGCRAALQRQPDHPDALRSLGLGALHAGRTEEAVLWLQAAVHAHPLKPQPHADLARALRRHGLGEAAQQHFDEAARLAPADPVFTLPAALHRAEGLDRAGQAAESLAAWEAATRSHPGAADAWAGLAQAQARWQGPAAAQASLSRALQIDPTRPELVERLGLALQEQRRWPDAAAVWEHLLQLQPSRPLTLGRLLHCKMQMADWIALEPLMAMLREQLDAGRAGAHPFALIAHLDDPALQRRGIEAFVRLHGAPAVAAPPLAPGLPGRRIRVGWVGGEFGHSATGALLVQALEQHDHSRFELVAFDSGSDDGSALRARLLAAFDEHVPIAALDDLAAAAAVRARGIDILVDLNGHFGHARPGLFVQRPAPLQVAWLGFPGTTGLPGMDYLVADRHLVPPGDERHYTEQVLRLPGCYQPRDTLREVAGDAGTRADHGLPEGAFVFCGINNGYKITPAAFDVWMRLLAAVPGSVLWLLLRHDTMQPNLAEEARARGIDPDRLVYAPPVDPALNLARLALADLFLDTWPCNAHTSAGDALWAGLPIVTCRGSTFAGRVAASLLHAAGLPQLVAEDPPAYEALALALAREPEQLQPMRERLQAARAAAPEADAGLHARPLMAAWQAIVERRLRGLPPASFDVPASG